MTEQQTTQITAPEEVTTLETTNSVASVDVKTTNDTVSEETENDIAPKEETIEAIDPQVTIEELSRKLATAEQKVAEYWDNLLRQRAEYDNLRKRTERDIERANKYALEKFALDLLPIKDSMELGLEAATKPETDLLVVREGLELTLKMIATSLEKFGIVEINPQNLKFDPQLHEAMAMQPDPNAEDGTVLYVHQKGYQLNDRLLRPARVIVAKAIRQQDSA